MANTQRARAPEDFSARFPDGTAARPARTWLPRPLVGETAAVTASWWVISRLLTLAVTFAVADAVGGDVDYYTHSLQNLVSGIGVGQTLPEYPLPVLGILVPEYLFAAGNAVAFAAVFVGSMLVLDAFFLALLWHVSGHRRSEAVTFWLWFLPAIGPMTYFRFDLVPAVLVGGAVLAAIKHPALSGAMVAIGAALKLWPAILLPAFLIRRVDRWRVLVAFCAAGGGLALMSLLVGGMDRLMSPLHWQSGRGLQIESVPAAPLMLVRSLDPERWLVLTSTFKSAEIFGTGVGTSLALTQALFFGGLLLLGVLWLRARTLPAMSAETLAWLVLATVAIMTVTNKVLSPQYILWLGGPLAALMVRAPADATVRRAVRLLMVIAVMTQLIFPILYTHLMRDTNGTVPVTLLLVARNVLLVWLTVIACRQVWTQTRREDVVAATPAVSA
ncbi:MAG: glycosyltransferase family 87 protein [Propionibacteriales bacterium]|nr:glycosyltransferase family 87 protein [Propionibacteriales bacterium]